MWPNADKSMRLSRRAMTLPEILIASAVALYVIAGFWSVHVMVYKWWHEIEPRISAQRIARTALLRIVEGIPDTTTGTITIGNKSYSRRNGMAWAFTTLPVISADKQSITYRLEPDASNIRRFSLGTDPSTGLSVVYYRDSSSTDRMIRSTIGITGLKFENVNDASGVPMPKVIRVTATVEKDVAGTRSQGLYHIKVEYSDVVYLRNAA